MTNLQNNSKPSSSTLGTLYLVPNTLGDIDRESQLSWVLPQEVISKSASLKYWVVENAKTSRAFLKAVSSLTPLCCPMQDMQMVEWRGPRSNIEPQQLIAPLLQGHDLGLMSEAGLPAIADPGAEIVAAAHNAKIKVVPLTGPSSLMLALMSSGMNGQRFLFQGYLPIKNPERSSTLKALEIESRKLNQTQLWIETPYRNIGMLENALACLDAKSRLCVAIDLSLPTQLVLSMTTAAWKSWISNNTEVLKSLDRRPAVFLLQA